MDDMIRCIALIGFLAVAGCGSGPGPQSAEELASAQSAVKTSLDAWKAGHAAAKWEKESASVKFVDEEWRHGAVLLDYKLEKAEGLRGENTRCWTVLTIRDRKGRRSEKEAVYSVKPGAPILVTRDPFY